MRRNQQPSNGLIWEADPGGVMATDKSVLDKITARIKDIIRIAEDAAVQAMKAEKPSQAKKRAGDLMQS